jgi:hypothetical protein
MFGLQVLVFPVLGKGTTTFPAIHLIPPPTLSEFITATKTQLCFGVHDELKYDTNTKLALTVANDEFAIGIS